ncbi:hypothetical protein [Nocardioides panzhihuensis]|uniref:Uncharacterized protein n=1 Tax=Nocardioides panzhihuensis TaxID=860243 RepID=A0A7Z0DKL5_9ACTN|nr:hypothetical protein [Nocardioides panzhihuensis]NYI76981.1 hypothetical protein [Nocardioides panzhihuensis]
MTRAPDADEPEPLMYGFSVLVCLPDGLSSPPSVGTGTVMRSSTLQGYGEAAGFIGFENLPIEDTELVRCDAIVVSAVQGTAAGVVFFGFWRFYRLS